MIIHRVVFVNTPIPCDAESIPIFPISMEECDVSIIPDQQYTDGHITPMSIVLFEIERPVKPDVIYLNILLPDRIAGRQCKSKNAINSQIFNYFKMPKTKW